MRTHFRPFTEVMRKSGREVTRKLRFGFLFCFPSLRFDVFSAYRDGQCCSAPKPGKEKQRSYYYCSAVLMVHRFRSSLICFTKVLRRSWREVTWKLPAQFEVLPLSPGLWRARKGSRMHTRYGSVHDLAQSDLR